MSSKTAKVRLDEPVKLGGADVVEFTVTAPRAGQLRGVKVAEILMMDASAHIRLIPRIAKPILTEADVAALSAADLTAFMSAIVPFFATKAQMEAMGPD